MGCRDVTQSRYLGYLAGGFMHVTMLNFNMRQELGHYCPFTSSAGTYQTLFDSQKDSVLRSGQRRQTDCTWDLIDKTLLAGSQPDQLIRFHNDGVVVLECSTPTHLGMRVSSCWELY